MTLKLFRSVAGTGLATILPSMNIACKKSKDDTGSIKTVNYRIKNKRGSIVPLLFFEYVKAVPTFSRTC